MVLAGPEARRTWVPVPGALGAGNAVCFVCTAVIKCAVGAGGAARNPITISSGLPGTTLPDLENAPPQWGFPCFCGAFPHSLQPRRLKINQTPSMSSRLKAPCLRGEVRSKDTTQTHWVQFQHYKGQSPLLTQQPWVSSRGYRGTAEGSVCVSRLHLLSPRTRVPRGDGAAVAGGG